MANGFSSPLAVHIDAFIKEKQASGCRYVTETAHLHRLDRFLCTQPDCGVGLSQAVVEQWIAKRPHERARTHKARVLLLRQFAQYLLRRDIPAHVPDSRISTTVRMDFTPYIFTREQINQLIKSVDNMPFDPRSPERHLVMPELFRLLYGCGLRAGEAARLQVADVNLDQGVLTVRQSKFRKDRLVPLAPALTVRLRRYVAALSLNRGELVFLPNPKGGRYCLCSLYSIFRHLLRRSGIPHGGRGRGPRMHDLRHTFAVHCLERWYRQGDDLNARLPLLVAYLGHANLLGTQRYLRLTPAVFPDITARLESFLNTSPEKI